MLDCLGIQAPRFGDSTLPPRVLVTKRDCRLLLS
jgi:hypothetical protein